MRADQKILSCFGALALAIVTVPVGTTPAQAQIQKHARVQHHVGARKSVARRHRAPRQQWAAPSYQAGPGAYVPAPNGAPVNGAPFGVSGCYGSRVQVYVPGQGLVWRPQVDCPYQDNP